MSLKVPTVATPGGSSLTPPLLSGAGSSGGGGGSLPKLPTGSATGNPRNKVALKPGHSLMDWIRLGRTKDLAGTGGRITKVTPEELAKHNTEEDAWIAIKDKVYNVTCYMDFHPGGIPELMRAVGTDGTALFDEIHKWVNYESMLAKCYIGPLDVDSPTKQRNRVKMRPSAASLTVNGLGSLGPPPPVGKPSPRYEWLQNERSMTIVVYTKWKDMTSEYVIIDRKEKNLMLTMFIEDHTYTVAVELEGEVEADCEVKVRFPSGKVEVVLQKCEPGRQWQDLGSPLPLNNKWVKTADREKSYRKCNVLSVEQVSHDTKLYRVGLPDGTRMSVPLGHHVYIRTDIDGVALSKPYTVVPCSLLRHQQDPQVMEGKVLYLLIKIYQDGALTPHIGKLDQGSVLEVSDHEGDFDVARVEECDDLVMCAAGTGFTPMAGLIFHSLVLYPKPNRKIRLIFFNKDEPDILWQEQLDRLYTQNEPFEVTHVLSQPNSDWAGLSGRIRKEVLESSVAISGKVKPLFCACGPRAFTDEAVRLAKEEFKYSNDQIHPFVG